MGNFCIDFFGDCFSSFCTKKTEIEQTQQESVDNQKEQIKSSKAVSKLFLKKQEKKKAKKKEREMEKIIESYADEKVSTSKSNKKYNKLLLKQIIEYLERPGSPLF